MRWSKVRLDEMGRGKVMRGEMRWGEIMCKIEIKEVRWCIKLYASELPEVIHRVSELPEVTHRISKLPEVIHRTPGMYSNKDYLNVPRTMKKIQITEKNDQKQIIKVLMKAACQTVK